MSRATELADWIDGDLVSEEEKQVSTHLRALDASHRQLLEALEELYEDYCARAHEEYDYLNHSWTPEVENDTMAINARTAIATAKELT